MEPTERRTVAVAASMHGVVHSVILSIPVFLAFAWGPEFGVDAVTLALLAAVGYAGYGLSSVPFGFLADRVGSPRLLLVCAAGIVVSLAAMALSPGLVALAASLAALGVCAGIYHPAGLSLISRTLHAPGRGMGWHGLGGSLGIALGPALAGGLLVLGWPWRSVAAVLAVPAVASFLLLLAARLRDDIQGSHESGFVESVRRTVTPGFAMVLAVYAFSGLTYWGSLTFLPLFVGAGAYAILLGLGAVGQVLAGYLADRPRPERTLAVLSLMAAASVLGVSSGFPTIGVPSALAFGFLLFALEPLQNTLAAGAVSEQRRGLAFGLTFVCVFGIGSLGAVLAGVLLDRGDTTSLFVALAGCLALSATSALAVVRVRRKHDPAG